jgi:hypothetical protein
MNRRLILALAPATLALATAAYAQPAAPPPGMRHEPSPEMKARHEAMMKQHVEDLKILLRLRPDQETALNALIAAHHPPGDRGLRREDRDDGPMTTPERLERMQQREAEMAARQAQRREALTKFYAALSPDQQRVFDALQRLQGHGGGRDGGPRMMRHRFGGPMPDGHEPG